MSDSQHGALREWLGLSRSMILSGERMTPQAEDTYTRARVALDALEASRSPEAVERAAKALKSGQQAWHSIDGQELYEAMARAALDAASENTQPTTRFQS